MELPKINISVNLRYYFPLIYILVLGGLTIFAGKYGFDKIKSQQAQIRTSEKTVNVMTDKSNQLKNFNVNYGNAFTSVSQSFPSRSSILIVYSQLKFYASQYGVILDDIRLSVTPSGDDKNYVTDDITFTVSGETDSVFNFLTAVNKLSPKTLVDRLDFSFAGGEVQADASINTFWANTKTTPDSATTPLVALSEKEKEILDEIDILAPPTIDLPDPSLPSSRTSPF